MLPYMYVDDIHCISWSINIIKRSNGSTIFVWSLYYYDIMYSMLATDNGL